MDDVLLQAKTAWSLAPELCAPTGCAWYHGVWPSLRALGLVAEPARHADFFARSLAVVGPRVLVSGAADAAMPGLVASSIDDVELAVLDRCATPVRLAVEWGSRHGVAVEAHVSDVLALAGDGSFDAVATHGLFSLVPRPQRAELARRWAGLLRPGGRLVTTSSLSSPATPDPFGFSAEAVDGFARRAAAAGAGDDIVAAARRWAERAHVHPVYDADDVHAVLDAAGFDVVIGVRDVHGPLGRGEGGPTSARSARYLEIVGTRR